MANYFEHELSESMDRLASEGWWKYKISPPATRRMRFISNAPFDYIACYHGQSVAMEAKSNTKLVTCFPFSRIAPHQLLALLHHKKSGGWSYIVINFRKPKSVAYAIEINDWLDYVKASDRKSVPLADFKTDTRFIPIPRGKIDGKLSWKLNVLVKHAFTTQGRIQWQESTD